MSRLLKSAISALSGNVISSGINIFIVFYITKKYGIDSYGAFSLNQAILMTISLLIKPNIWMLFTKEKVNNKCDIVNYSFTLDMVLSLISLILFLVICIVFNDFSYLLLLLFPLFYSNGYVVGYLRGENKFHIYSIIQILTSLLKVLFIYYYSEFNLILFTIIYFMIDVVIWGGGYIYVYFKTKPKFNMTVLKNKKSYFHFIFGTYLTSLLDLPVSQLDRIILSGFFNDTTLGIYSLIRRLCQIISVFVEPLCMVLFPTLSKLKTLKDSKIIIFKFMSVIFSFGSIGLFILYILFDWFNETLISGQLANYKNITLLYLLIQMIGLCFSWVNIILIAQNKIKINCYITLIANLMYICSLYYFVATYELLGGAIALCIQYLVTVFLKVRYIN